MPDHVVQHGEAAEGGRGHCRGLRGDQGADQDQGQGGEQHQQQHGQLQEVQVSENRESSFLLEVKEILVAKKKHGDVFTTFG